MMIFQRSQATSGRCLGAVLAALVAGFGVGATGAARADDAAMLVAPQRIYAGSPATATVSAFDSETREPIDRAVRLSLLTADGTTLESLSPRSTGARGHVRIEFPVPDVADGTYRIRAAVEGVAEPLEVQAELSRTPGILIETDKPIYKPSQTIQGRVVLLDSALRPVAGDVEVTFHDAKGIRIDRRQLTTTEYGVAAFSLDLASEVNFGTWKVRASSQGAESVRDVRVEEYVLPRYDLGVDMARSWALVDEEVVGSVEARYFFGQPVAGEATVVAKRWVGVWEEYASATGSLDEGRFAFTLPEVGFVSGTEGASGQGTITLDVSVTDSTGHTQETTEVVTVSESPVVISLVSRSKSLKPGIPTEVVVGTKEPDGTPRDASVAVKIDYLSEMGDAVGSVTRTVATSAGIGSVSFEAPEDTAYAELSASAEVDGHTSRATLTIDGAWAPSGSFLSLSRVDGDAPARVGDVLRFSALSTHPGTVYYEVFAAGRTILSDAVESDTFAVTLTPEMAGTARVVAYKINPSSEVAADSVELSVQVPLSARLAAGFSEETVRPGEPVVVEIDAGTSRPTLLGVAVVDRSVLALGQSRLHMADVFAELDLRFMEPRVEVHEGGGDPWGGGPMVDGMPWGGRVPQTEGALDTLHEAGLEVAVTEGLVVPEGGVVGWWRFAEELDDVAAGPPGAEDGGNGVGPSEPPIRVRQFFPETWVWQPLLVTDETGRATLELTAPDSITGWQLSVVGTCPGAAAAGGGIFFGEDELKVFQEFFVEPSLPYSAVRGEEFPVKVDIFNYIDQEQTVALSFSAEAGLELTGPADVSVTVPPGAAMSVDFPVRPTALGDFPLEITARGSALSDAVRKELKVIPEGRPVESVANGVIEAGTRRPLETGAPPDAVEGSARAYLHVTPSPVAQTMNGVSDLLGMPYGCGEQNMIFLAPDIEILKYLREIGELSPEIRATAEYYVNVGYQRQLTFRTDDGGFAAFGGADGSLWLTAFVLSTFSGGREVRDIDESVLAAAAGMLVSRQNEDGSFRTDDFLIHKEMDGGLENLYAMTAYVTNALADYVYLAADASAPASGVVEAMVKAAGYLESQRTALPGVNDDPYSLSIAAVALQKIPGFAGGADAIVDRLLELAIIEGTGMHWEPYPVETTGYAATALLAGERPEAAAVIEWITTQRNALGGYGQSTQDTVVSIRALFLAARKIHADLDVVLSVRSGDEVLREIRVDETNYDLFHQLELPIAPTAGLELVSTGRGNVGYQVVVRYNVPGEILPPPRDMLMDVTYDAVHVEVDDVVDVRVKLDYTGPKEETGMVIADVGVPTGFAAVRSSLDALLELEPISRVETAGRKVIVYLDALRSGTPVEFTFQVVALYPVRAEGPLSKAYEYYDPDVEAYDQEGGIVIGGGTGDRSFVRGDTNRDAAIDLSDAVATLDFLFRGRWVASEPICMDASDANDDGNVNITDPIYLLQYLFLGGARPPAPFPEEGVDETADDLDC